MRFLNLTMLATLVCCVALARAQDKAENKLPLDEALANAALAERLAQFGQVSLANRTIVPATLRQSAGLLEQAASLNPTEPRFLRLLIEAYLQLGGDEGRDGAIASLERYRRLVPEDQAAQVRLIDLYHAKMDKADDARKYLDQLLATANLAPEIKSHVAVLSAKLALDRDEVERAGKLLDQALELFPLSPGALRLKYQWLGPDGPPDHRAAVLLQIIRSNPTNPGAMVELAALAADCGLVDESLRWYQISFNLSQRLGLKPDFGQLTAFTAELVVADQHAQAQNFTDSLLKQDPTNVDAAFLGLLMAKRAGEEQKVQDATDKARAAVMARLGAISNALNNPDAPAPEAPPAPDIAADVKKLAQAANPQLTNAYAGGIADLAWIDIYFNSKPTEAQQHVESLRQLLPADSATLARLEGWSYLVDGRKDEAKVKLSAVADRDPLAALGMITIEGGNGLEPAKKLLNDNASGLIGAMLIEAVRGKFGLMPPGPHAAAVKSHLDKFPKDWLDILDFNKVRAFYALKAEPVRVGHVFGEPMLARVTLSNTSNYDITVGPESTIRPDIWFDAQLKGLVQRPMPGVAFDRLSGKLLLKPKEAIVQTVRLDQGDLVQIMMANPQIGMQLFFSLLSNPMTQQTGIAPGPAGYRVQLGRVVERSPAPLNDPALNAMFNQVANGAGDARMRALNLMATFGLRLKAQDNPQMKAKGTEIADFVRKTTGDANPAVRAEAMYLTALLSDESMKEGVIRQMLANASPTMRMLGLDALAQAIEPGKRKELAKSLASDDADPLVKKRAASVIEVADLPPPTTQPSAETTAGGQGDAIGR